MTRRGFSGAAAAAVGQAYGAALSRHRRQPALDMALAEYSDGLLLIEPVFGEGFLDLHRIVSTVRQARPAARFTVEQITRNPLKVPVLTDRYWASFPERNGATLRGRWEWRDLTRGAAPCRSRRHSGASGVSKRKKIT